MDETTNTVTTMQLMVKINEFQHEIIKAMNYIREDVHELKDELKGEIKELRQELRDYKEENNRRWDENNRRWEENHKKWEQYEANRKEDRKTLLDILTIYDLSISEQIGDPNVNKMKKII